jgi:hypothetical protein
MESPETSIRYPIPTPHLLPVASTRPEAWKLQCRHDVATTSRIDYDDD